MRRARRTRMGNNRQAVVSHMVSMAKADTRTMELISNKERNKAFGRILNAWLDDRRESVIDRYVDEEAFDVTNYVLNIIAKEQASESPAETVNSMEMEGRTVTIKVTVN